MTTFSIPDDLPECPQCGRPIRSASRVGVSARLRPCGHIVPEDVLRPSHVHESEDYERVPITDGGRDVVDLVDEAKHEPTVRCTVCDEFVDVVRSTDANGSLQLDVEIPDEDANWRFDARVIRSSIDLVRAFRAGEGVTPNEAPDWMDIVIQQTNQRLAGGL